VLHINAITNLYYIFQLYTFLICKNMANTKTQNPCTATQSEQIQSEVGGKQYGYILPNKIMVYHITHSMQS